MERIKFALYNNPLTWHYFWRTKNKEEVDLIEVHNQEMTAFEVKLSRDDAHAPTAFRKAYPNVPFYVVSRHNLQNFLGI